eukprot:6180821-Pyramimonas_sp.AAC.2
MTEVKQRASHNVIICIHLRGALKEPLVRGGDVGVLQPMAAQVHHPRVDHAVRAAQVRAPREELEGGGVVPLHHVAVEVEKTQPVQSLRAPAVRRLVDRPRKRNL